MASNRNPNLEILKRSVERLRFYLIIRLAPHITIKGAI